MTDLTAAELDKLLKQHREKFTYFADKPKCFGCGQMWPCLITRMATELQRRRDAEGHQERML